MKHIGIIIVIILSFGISLFAGELYMKTTHPQLTLDAAAAFSFSCFEEGQHRWIKLAANKTCTLTSAWNAFSPIQIKTNSLGMRNPEVTIPKPQGVKRILFVGDSFTMGWGVQEHEAFARKTGELLAQTAPQLDIETINAGFTAAGPSGYYLYLKHFTQNLSPDIVVVGFFLGNDITARTDVEWVKTDAQGLPDVVRSKTTYIDHQGTIRFKDMPLRYKIPILRNSHVFIGLMNIFSPLASTNEPSKEYVKQLTCLFNKTCHDLDKAKTEVKTLFKAMNDITKSRGTTLVVLLIPDDYQVNAYPSYAYNYKLPLLPTDRRRINDEFTSFFNSEGIAYLDVLPTFMEQSRDPLYIPEDGHWNAKGHAFAAALLSKKLLSILNTQ